MASSKRFIHPPICQAARDGDLGELLRLIAAGGNPDERDSQGITALMHACMQNRLACAKALVDHGAELDLVDHFSGLSALGWCANHLRPDCMAFLLESGASPNNTALNGQTPLVQCCHSLHNWTESASACFHLLANHPLCDLNAANSGGRTAAMACALYGQVECARILLARGADFSLRDHEGLGVLDYAAQQHPDHRPQAVLAFQALAESFELARAAAHPKPDGRAWALRV